jgi:hypothetical protein
VLRSRGSVLCCVVIGWECAVLCCDRVAVCCDDTRMGHDVRAPTRSDRTARSPSRQLPAPRQPRIWGAVALRSAYVTAGVRRGCGTAPGGRRPGLVRPPSPSVAAQSAGLGTWGGRRTAGHVSRPAFPVFGLVRAGAGTFARGAFWSPGAALSMMAGRLERGGGPMPRRLKVVGRVLRTAGRGRVSIEEDDRGGQWVICTGCGAREYAPGPGSARPRQRRHADGCTR